MKRSLYDTILVLDDNKLMAETLNRTFKRYFDRHFPEEIPQFVFTHNKADFFSKLAVHPRCVALIDLFCDARNPGNPLGFEISQELLGKNRFFPLILYSSVDLPKGSGKFRDVLANITKAQTPFIAKVSTSVKLSPGSPMHNLINFVLSFMGLRLRSAHE